MTVLTRFQPIREFSTLQDRINRLFRDSFSDGQEALTTSSFAPAVDVYEDEHQVSLKIEVPGIPAGIGEPISPRARRDGDLQAISASARSGCATGSKERRWIGQGPNS